jgi:16S rRNA (uracil1498-N3)-methyltransferase
MPGKQRRAASPPDAGITAARYRFFLSEPPAGESVTLHGDLAHRLARVLRLTPGTSIDLFDGSGRVWTGILAALSGGTVHVHLAGEPRRLPPEPPAVLLAGLIRSNRFEWLLEKATELGATVIQPVLCERSAVRPAEIGGTRLDRWRRITVEAAEQCERVTVPELRLPLPLADALASAPSPLYIAADPAHGASPSLAALAVPRHEPVSLLVGPEGGLSPAEVEAARAAGGQAVTLGALVLRAETAALAALAVVSALRTGGAGSRQ